MISIVMSYYNRLRQLDFTLSTIAKSTYQDYEIVLVDDFSDHDHDPAILLEKYPQLPLRIIRMAQVVQHRWYCNPCIPYNVGFRQSRGETVIIQNPECCHIGDILSHCNSNIDEQTYLSYHCWSCTKDDVKQLHQGQELDYIPKPKALWYNHAQHRPESYHFCTAITRNNLKKINGFDERFANGFSYDDNEFVQRIRNLQLNIKFVDQPHVIHQPHPKFLTMGSAVTDNRQLFYDLKNTGLITAPNKEPIP
jgi:GT2 family glycosyltransferase